MNDWIDALERLQKLKESGALNDDEYVANKCRIMSERDGVPETEKINNNYDQEDPSRLKPLKNNSQNEAVPPATHYMDKKITFEQTLPIWWSFAWRATIFSFILYSFFGMLDGFLIAASGGDRAQPGGIGAIFATIGSIPVSIWSFREALRKNRVNFNLK